MQWPILPDYGCLLRWPEDGTAFIHPDDVAFVTSHFPSERVFRRHAFDGDYYHCNYGSEQFRIRPCLFVNVPYEGIEVGDAVETTGTCMSQDLFVATVQDVLLEPSSGALRYRLQQRGMTVPQLYSRSDLRLIQDKAQIRNVGPSRFSTKRPYPTPKRQDE